MYCFREIFAVFLAMWTIDAMASSSSTLLTNEGKCRGMWRSDKLVGKCFGLSPIQDFFKGRVDKLKHLGDILPSDVKSPTECRALCCNIGPECVTWQFQWKRDDMCKIGGPVRLGMEGADTVNWCDPSPPDTWSGYRLNRSPALSTKISATTTSLFKSYSHGEIAHGGSSACEAMKGAAVPHQCFGLGPERLHPITKTRMSLSECEAACCADPTCEIWQFNPGTGRGCFYNEGKGISCGEKADSPYIGGRKCIAGFC